MIDARPGRSHGAFTRGVLATLGTFGLACPMANPAFKETSAGGSAATGEDATTDAGASTLAMTDGSASASSSSSSSATTSTSEPTATSTSTSNASTTAAETTGTTAVGTSDATSSTSSGSTSTGDPSTSTGDTDDLCLLAPSPALDLKVFDLTGNVDFAGTCKTATSTFVGRVLSSGPGFLEYRTCASLNLCKANLCASGDFKVTYNLEAFTAPDFNGVTCVELRHFFDLPVGQDLCTVGRTRARKVGPEPAEPLPRFVASSGAVIGPGDLGLNPKHDPQMTCCDQDPCMDCEAGAPGAYNLVFSDVASEPAAFSLASGESIAIKIDGGEAFVHNVRSDLVEPCEPGAPVDWVMVR